MNNYRYEIKFILDEASKSRALTWLYAHTSAREEYPMRIVNSVYFDDPGYSAVRDNLAGISDRKKTRLRWYNTKNDKQNVQEAVLEIKKRCGRLGLKDRYNLKGLESKLLSLQCNKLITSIEEYIDDKEDFLFEDYLSPALHIAYEREYYAGQYDIRATFDKNIMFYSTYPHSKLFENISISYPHQIMELKFDPKYKNEIVQSLRRLNLTPKRHSKYLAGMAAFGYAVWY